MTLKKRRVMNPTTQKRIPWEALYTCYDTFMIFCADEREAEKVRPFAAEVAAKVYWTNIYQDIFAVPSLRIFADPTFMEKDVLEMVVSFFQEIEDYDRLIFTNTLPELDGLDGQEKTAFRVMPGILDDPGLFGKEIRQARRWAVRHKPVNYYNEYDPRIFRILVLYRLSIKKRMTPAAELAERFNVSLRTIQRDLACLAVAGKWLSGELAEEEKAVSCERFANLPKIIRVLNFFNRLKIGEKLRCSALALEFGVDVRTIQREIKLIESSGLKNKE